MPSFEADNLTLHKINVAPMFRCTRCHFGPPDTSWAGQKNGEHRRVLICRSCGARAVATFRVAADNSRWEILSVDDME
jgi:hypothetical protein